MDDTRGIRAVDVGLLIVRLALGAVFFAHGSQKLLGWFGGPGPAGFVGGMSQMGIPAVLAWLAIIAEFFGALGLIFGVLPRLSALGISIVMAVAIFMVHLPNGFFMNWSGQAAGEGYEFHIVVIAAALLILLAGPGRLSVLPDVEGRLVSRRT